MGTRSIAVDIAVVVAVVGVVAVVSRGVPERAPRPAPAVTVPPNAVPVPAPRTSSSPSRGERNPSLIPPDAASQNPAAPTAPAADPLARIPSTRFAIADRKKLRIIRVSHDGLVVERTVTTPAAIVEVGWSGDTIAVSLAGPHTVGFITDAGYIRAPSITWPRTGVPAHAPDAKRADYDALYPAIHDMWVRHCTWQDKDGCVATLYATIAPTVGEPTEHYPGDYQPTQLTWFELPPDVDAELHSKCGKIEFESKREYIPPTLVSAETGHPMVELTDAITHGDHLLEVTWIAAVPPIFAAGAAEHDVLFERCAVSQRYRDFAPRSDGFVAVYGRELLVAWRGHQVGTIATFGGTAVAWEPAGASAEADAPPDHPSSGDRRLREYRLGDKEPCN